MNPEPQHRSQRGATTVAQAFLRTAGRGILLARVLALCAHSVAYAQPAQPMQSLVTPEQKFASGYLEAVATGYDNGLAMNGAEGIADLRPRPQERGPVMAPNQVPSSPATTGATPSLISSPMKPGKASEE